MRNSVASSHARPVNCRPTGSRSPVSPHGTLIAGSPASGALTVNTSARYICSGSSVVRRAETPASGSSASRRRRRPERALEIAANQRPHLLGLQVIRVVVAGAEDVGAEHDAAFHLGAESGAARPVVHVAERRRVGRADAVADAVVACEVGARFGGADEVVHRNRVRAVRQLDRAHDRAQPLQRRPDSRRSGARTSSSRPSSSRCRGTPTRRPPAPPETRLPKTRHVPDRGCRVAARSDPLITSSVNAASATERRAGRSDRATRQRRSGRSARRVRTSA